MFFSLALRNIIRNKKNSGIIALLIAVITFLFFIGNSFLGKADRGIHLAYVDSLTGDVVVETSGEITMNLFGANAPVIEEYFSIPVLPAYETVMELVSEEAGIAGITSQVSGSAYMELLSIREPVLLSGVDASTYFSLFPGIILEGGRFLQSGEYGVMITKERAERIERQSGEKPAIGAPVLLTSAGRIGFKIREVPLVGIFSYQNPGQFMNDIVIIDPQTVRVLNSIQVAGSSAEEVSDADLRLLSADTDDLFGEVFAEDAPAADTPGGGTSDGGTDVAYSESPAAGFSVDELQTFLGETGDEGGEETGGDWNFIILRLEKGISPAAFISSLNEKIGSYGLSAVNWRIAAGSSAILMLLIQALYNGGMFLVSITSVITVINILLIAVFRRTREIGTLKAIGASDAYIRSLILTENLILAVIAGCAGIAGGWFFSGFINRLELKIPNNLVAALLGGPVLELNFLPHIAFFSFGMAVILGIAASVYPVETAVRIEPMAAVRRG